MLENGVRRAGQIRPAMTGPYRRFKFLEADTAVLALGYWPDRIIGETTPQLDTQKWGLIVVDQESGATSRPGVFAGGDGVTGPDLEVTAMVSGRKAAKAIDHYLAELN
ncbi:MAG: FAD-dependent oxidoreductase [Anaerolineales bacterium]